VQEVLSTFNFDLLLPALSFAKSKLGIGSYYVARYFLFGSLFLLAISLWFRFGQHFKPRWKHFSAAVICVFALRVLLFDTPFSWRQCKEIKPVTESEFYGLWMIWKNPEHFLKDLFPGKTPYLAIGSSQTARIFAKNPLFKVFAFAGMRPLDFVLYQKNILAENPSNILLYLSDFDLAKAPNFQIYVYAPFQGLELFKLYRQLNAHRFKKAPWVFSLKNIFAFLFPEYKYAEIPRILANSILLDSFGPRRPFFPLTQEAEFEISARGLKGLNPAYIDSSLSFLEDFILFCGRHNIRVIVLEGQYNPLAYSKENRIASRITKEKLRRLLKKHPRVVFIPLEELPPLYPKDFTDLVHVTPEAGKRFTQFVYSYLQKIDPKR